jgi:hypothetical protein
MTKPLVPRNWKTTNAITDAHKRPLVVRLKQGKRGSPFNGSLTNPRNKKRPITLPGADKGKDDVI